MDNHQDSLCLTILTPAYNRAYIIPKLFDSLQRQTMKNFQWLIIDDGSTDETESIVKGFRPNGFYVNYFKKNNGGKHTALNFSHPYIEGKFLMIVDSDDYLTDDAVESITSLIHRYDNQEDIACFSFQRASGDGRVLVDGMTDEPVVSNHIDYRLNRGLFGDCAEVIRTKAFVEFPFPVFANERFMSEGFLWVSLANKYKTVYVNKVVYICDYLADGLTQSGRKMRIRCPLGGMANSNMFLSAVHSPRLNIKLSVKQALLFVCYGKFAGRKYSEMRAECNRPGLMTLIYPLGVAMYWNWKQKYQ